MDTLTRKTYTASQERETLRQAELQDAVNAGLTVPTFATQKGFETWLAGMKQPRRMSREQFVEFCETPEAFTEKDANGKQGWKGIVGPREWSEKHIVHALSISTDIQHNKISGNTVLAKALGLDRVKKSELLTQPMINYRELVRSITWASPAALDMSWMQFFTKIDLRGALIGKIFDFLGAVQWKELQPNEAIQYSHLGQDAAKEIQGRRFGGGILATDNELKQMGMIGANDIFAALRIAAEVYKATMAYTALMATASIGATQTYDATGTTQTDKDINTINAAASTMIQYYSQNTAGLPIAMNQPMILLANATYMPRLERAFAAIRGNTSGQSVVIAYNIRPVYTWNAAVPALPDGAKMGAHLIMPGGRIYFATMRDLRTNEESNFDTNSIKFGAQEEYNVSLSKDAKGNTKQITRVQLEA